MDSFEKRIRAFIQEETGLEDFVLERPPKPELGDYAFPCFPLAKILKKAPQQIAKELAGKFETDEKIREVKATGPYVNFFLDTAKLTEDTLAQIKEEGKSYGSSHEGKGKTKIVEHTSINPNASPHVGRARNALIGDAIVRLLRFQGYDVDVRYWVNDIGKQIAYLVIAAEGRGSIAFTDLLELYIDINKKAQQDPQIEQQAFELLRKMEQGDDAVRKRFRHIVDVCIGGQQEIFTDLDIHYDQYDYESSYLYSGKTGEALKKLEKTGKLFEDGHGRWVMDLKGYGLAMEVPVLVLSRADKTSLYATRDVSYWLDKMAKGDNVWVLGEDQKLYAEQICAVLKELEMPIPQVIHYSFVLLKEGKMSTRKGNVVLLEEFMREVTKKASEEIHKRWEKEDQGAAKVIGYGALKFTMLRVSPEKSVTFDLERALSFEGETAPYIQYSYARICSILEKHGKDLGQYDPSKLKEPLEQQLIRQLADFPALVKKAEQDLHPHLIANYLYNLASLFNEFYHQHQILKADDVTKDARLALVTAIRQVLETGLSLLGIGVLEKM